MPSLSAHPSRLCTKMLLIGDSKCLAANTEVSVTRGEGKGKRTTIAKLYFKFNKSHHNKHNDLATFIMSDVGGYAALNEVESVVFSGQKPVRSIWTADTSISATDDHLFSTPDGWIKAVDLKVGMRVHTWFSPRHENNPKLVRRQGSSRHNRQGRVYVYSIPNHPYANAHWIAGKNYKRAPRSRIVLEAAMNGMSTERFIHILRTDPTTAVTLAYLDLDGKLIHHLDHNRENDSLDNLVILSHTEHALEHSQDRNIPHKEISVSQITTIGPYFETDTFDISMKSPHNNFIANNFVVHNSGKTGALASLARAGYNLRILDFDNNLEILGNLLLNDPAARERVVYETFTNSFQVLEGKVIPVGTPDAFPRAMKLLHTWKTPTHNFGSLRDWTSKDVLVIDSFSFMAAAAFWYVRALNKRASGQDSHPTDFGGAQECLRGVLEIIRDDAVKCNVIVIAHIKYTGVEEGTDIPVKTLDIKAKAKPGEAPPQTVVSADIIRKETKGYVNSIGRALGPEIPRYFPTMVQCESEAAGNWARRTIRTRPSGLIDLAVPVLGLPDVLPQETGLADIFKALQASPAKEPPTTTPPPQPTS